MTTESNQALVAKQALVIDSLTIKLEAAEAQIKELLQEKENLNTSKPIKSMKELAQKSIEVQDACNLSGVVHGFSRAMESLCKHIGNTEERNQHPISVMWASKIESLTQCSGYMVFTKAYDAVQKLVND
jgi:myo-inositol-1-phosphate synthase